VKEEDAGVCGDRDPDFVRDLKTPRAFEVLLGQEDLDVPEELLPVLRREAAVEGDVSFHDG
jgi:hypothetical protein